MTMLNWPARGVCARVIARRLMLDRKTAYRILARGKAPVPDSSADHFVDADRPTKNDALHDNEEEVS